MKDVKRRRLRLGLWVLAALVALTWFEMWLAFRVPRPLVWLVLINVADAALIVAYFMHVGHLWSGEEHA